MEEHIAYGRRNKMKKTWKMMLVMAVSLGISGHAFAMANPFADVPANDWSYKSIETLGKAGLIENYQDKFGDKKVVTRYEMAEAVANAMTKADKADAATKAELSKLQTEYSEELKTLGYPGMKQESKDKIQFNFWTRYLLGKESGVKAGKESVDQQIRYKLMLKSQIDKNAWVFARIGTDDTTSALDYTNNIAMQQAYVRFKSGNWNINLGRQGDNASNPANLLNTGMLWMSSSGWDGVSAFQGTANDHFFIGGFQRTFPGGVVNANTLAGQYTGTRTFTIVDAAKQLTPQLTVLGTYVKDNGVKNGSDSVIDFKSIGSYYKFGSKYTLSTEYGKNSRAAYASSVADSDGIGWVTDLKYGNTDMSKPGSTAIHMDFRRMDPGLNPFSGWENPGGPYKPTNQGLAGNCSNVQGIGLYYEYVPVKNVFVQLAAFRFKTVTDTSATTGLDQKYRPSYRLMVDTFF